MPEFGHSSPSLQFALSISTEIVLRFDKHIQSCNCHQNLEYFVYLPHQKSLMSPSQPHPQPWQPLTCFLPCVCVCVCVCTLSRSIMSSSLQPQGLQPTRLLCPWDFPAKNPGVGCHFLLQGVFLIQGLNPHLLHWQVDSSPLSHLGSPFFPIVLPFSECHTDGSIQSVLSNLASFIPHGAFLLLSHISGTDVPVKYGM